MAPLTNAKVLVIGGSSGIGFGVAQAALAEGATVVIASSSKEKVQAAAARLGNTDRVIAEQADILSEESIKALFQRVGDFNHLVITVGRVLFDNNGSIKETNLKAKRDLFDDRYWGSLFCVQQAIPSLKNGGSITFTSGVGGARPPPGRGHLVGVAGAVNTATYGLSLDLAGDNIRVNTIAPGLVDTEIFDALPGGQKEALFERFLSKIPLKRVGSPAELAEAYLFAMKCTFLTGQVIYVDGGQLVA